MFAFAVSKNLKGKRMPTKVLSYNCEICGTAFPDEFTAATCERNHIDWKKLKIIGALYEFQKADFFSMPRHKFPSSLQIFYEGSESAVLYTYGGPRGV